LSIRIFLGVSIIEQGRFCPPAETGLSIFRITGVDDNGDMQIYSENPATNVESNIRKLPHICPVTPVLGNKSGFNQENIPLNLNRTPLSIVQSRATIQQPRSPAYYLPPLID
jgi:hypothetical protein